MRPFAYTRISVAFGKYCGALTALHLASVVLLVISPIAAAILKQTGPTWQSLAVIVPGLALNAANVWRTLKKERAAHDRYLATVRAELQPENLQ